MTKQDFEDLVALARQREDGLLQQKGKDYTIGSDDRLYNFKEVAEMTGQTPLQVWATYFLKHVFSIMAYTKNGSASEDIEGRFDDARNYLYLGEALIAEAEEKLKPTPTRDPYHDALA